MRKLIFLTIIAAAVFSSCRVIPYYTTVDKMAGINPGMKLDAVSATLGVNPHGYYLDVNNGKKIVVYKYKHRYHKVLKIEVPTEHGLAGGSPRFRKPSNAYFVFDQYSGKLEGYITDLGRKSGEDLLMEESYLRLFLNNPGKMKDIKSGSAKSKAVPLSKKKAGKAKRSRTKSASKDKLKANRTPKGASAKSNKKGSVSKSSKNVQNSKKGTTSYSVGSGRAGASTRIKIPGATTTGTFPLLYNIVDYRLNNGISVGMGVAFRRESWRIDEEPFAKTRYFNFGLRTKFHYGRKEKIDMYSGISVGYGLVTGSGGSIFYQLIPFGMHYNLTEKMGIHAETGFGGPYRVAIGLTFKL